MNCVYEPEELSLACVKEVVSDVISGELTITTGRKVLKLIDTGLATFEGTPDISFSLADTSPKGLAKLIQKRIPEDDEVMIQSSWIEIIALLIELWSQIKPLLPKA